MAQTGIGTIVYVSAGTPATLDVAGFEALTWTEVGEVMEIGEYGADTNVVTYNIIKSGDVQKELGYTDNGSLPLKVVDTPADAGQVLLKAAQASGDDLQFKIELGDGQIDYFSSVVSSFKRNVSGEAIVDRTAQVNIKTKVYTDLP